MNDYRDREKERTIYMKSIRKVN